MARKIIWSKRATSKLSNITEFLNQEWGENLAKQLYLYINYEQYVPQKLNLHIYNEIGTKTLEKRIYAGKNMIDYDSSDRVCISFISKNMGYRLKPLKL